MRRSALIREVYRELRASTRGTIGSGELLACASALVELFEEEEEPQFDVREAPAPLDLRPVDVAIADGWRLVYRDWETLYPDEAAPDEDAFCNPLYHLQLQMEHS